MNALKSIVAAAFVVIGLGSVAYANLVPNAPVSGTPDYSACELSPADVDKEFSAAADEFAKAGITVVDLGRFSYRNDINVTVYFQVWSISGGPNDGKFFVAFLDSDGVCIDKSQPPLIVDESTIAARIKVSQAS